MGKCFDGIRRLDFGDDPNSIDIFAMISGEGEKVSLGKNLKARGNVEKWLCDVEAAMMGEAVAVKECLRLCPWELMGIRLNSHGTDSLANPPQQVSSALPARASRPMWKSLALSGYSSSLPSWS